MVEGGIFSLFSPKKYVIKCLIMRCIFIFTMGQLLRVHTFRSARVLNSLNIGKLKKEMQIINFSDDTDASKL